MKDALHSVYQNCVEMNLYFVVFDLDMYCCIFDLDSYFSMTADCFVNHNADYV